jgi:4'-phosphopantetheinyl transferase
MKCKVFVPGLRTKKLASGEVDVWVSSLGRPEARFLELLSCDERDRAARYISRQDGNRYIVRRGVLRLLLGRYADIEPDLLTINYNEKGKPVLADECNDTEVSFNLSHSAGLAVYAFTRNRETGIDIEKIRDIPDMEKIFNRVSSPKEKDVFSSLPENKRKEAFFSYWTRKEAFVKAVGDGLSYPLDKFDVSLAPGEPARLLGIRGNRADIKQWSIHDLEIANGFKAALAVKGQVSVINYRRWEEKTSVLSAARISERG